MLLCTSDTSLAVAWGCILTYQLLSMWQIFSSREVTDHLTRIRDTLSNSTCDWEKRVEAVTCWRCYWTLCIFRLTLKSVSAKNPSTKSFYDLNNDGMPYDPIKWQGQGHEVQKLLKMANFKVCLLCQYACNQKTKGE